MNEVERIIASGEFRQIVAYISEVTVQNAISKINKKPEDFLPELMSLTQTKKFLHVGQKIYTYIRKGDLWTVSVQGKPKFRKSDLILFNLHGTARVNGNKPPQRTGRSALLKCEQ